MSATVDLYTIPRELRQYTVTVNGNLLASLDAPLEGWQKTSSREEPDALDPKLYARKPLDKEDTQALTAAAVTENSSVETLIAAAGGMMDKHKCCRDVLIATAGRTALLESALNLLYSRASICKRNLEE